MSQTFPREHRRESGRAKGCERYIWSHGEDRLCGQTVGLLRWHDTSGTAHAACRFHVGTMTSIYPVADAPWPGDLEQADPITAAKGYREGYSDAGYTEAEARMLWGDR